MKRRLLIATALVVVTCAAFHGVGACGFVDFDDDTYVTNNSRVQRGLQMDSIVWAVTATDGANWHPVTWLSHMVDVQFFGLDAGGHHLMSLALHAVNVALLFLLLFRMTGATWRSALVAILFAIHPLHVESVAWISERKDLLSTFFWIVTTWAWLHFLESRTYGRYALVIVLYALGLMSKPMLVTLPFTLLLLDFWPLKRGTRPPLLKEKLPLFAMSAASCVVTFLVQRQGRAVESLDVLPFTERLANACWSYLTYVGKTFWPADLACFYPHAHPGLLAWRVVGAAAFLTAVSILAVRLAKPAPFFAVGWFWYLGTLVPVIGLVQVGAQARADRYTYLPVVGIFVVIAWGLGEIATRFPATRPMLAAVVAVLLLPLIAMTRAQVDYWADNVSLFGRAVAVTADNSEMQSNLGLALYDKGEVERAIVHYREAIRIAPRHKRALGNLGLALATTGDDAGAIEAYDRFLAIDPGDATIHFQLARALARVGRTDDALAHYAEALRLRPAYPEAHDNLANLLAARGRVEDAIVHYETSLRLNPGNAIGRFNFATLLIGQDRLGEAETHLVEALRLRPEFAEAHNALGVVRMRQGRNHEAAAEFAIALRLRPDLEGARSNLEAVREP